MDDRLRDDQIADLRRRVEYLESEVRRHADTVMLVERNLVQRMDTLRSEISSLIRGMHEENLDTIKSLSTDIRVLNGSMTTLFADKHRIEGGATVLQTFLSPLRGPIGKFMAWLFAMTVASGFFLSQVTAGRLHTFSVWLFGT